MMNIDSKKIADVLLETLSLLARRNIHKDPDFQNLVPVSRDKSEFVNEVLMVAV